MGIICAQLNRHVISIQIHLFLEGPEVSTSSIIKTKYLGSTLTKDGKYVKEIKTRTSSTAQWRKRGAMAASIKKKILAGQCQSPAALLQAANDMEQLRAFTAT